MNKSSIKIPFIFLILELQRASTILGSDSMMEAFNFQNQILLPLKVCIFYLVHQEDDLQRLCYFQVLMNKINQTDFIENTLNFANFVNLLQNLVHYRPPSQGSSPCPSLQNFPGQSGPNTTTYSANAMEAENNEYMKSALCQQIKEENGHNSG